MKLGKIGSRSMFGWRNPYVTDGLVAMWDGVWNVGGGVEHDSNSYVWWDCIGGLPILNAFSNNYFGTDCLVMPKNSLGVVGFAQGCCPGDASTYGFVHMEVVLEFADTSHASEPFGFGIGRRALWLHRTDSGVGLSRDSYKTWQSGSLDLSQSKKFSVSASYGSVSSTSAVTCWLNGETATNTGAADSWNTNPSRKNGIVFGYSTTYPLYGSYFALRLYSRALTAEEVAANYAVDNARFNLTGGGVNV